MCRSLGVGWCLELELGPWAMGTKHKHRTPHDSPETRGKCAPMHLDKGQGPRDTCEIPQGKALGGRMLINCLLSRAAI